MADDIVQTISLEGQDDVVQGFNQISAAGAASAEKVSEAFEQANAMFAKMQDEAERTGAAFANIKAPNLENVFASFSAGVEKASEHIKEFGSDVGETLGKLGEAFGGVGQHAAELFEKLAHGAAEAGPAIAKIGTSFADAGGGMKGAAAAAGALGEALGPLGVAAGVVGSAFAGLAVSMASVGAHLQTLKESTEGTEADFARLENAATQSGIGIDAMVEAGNRLRDSARSSVLQLANYIEMFAVMRDRAKEAGEQVDLMQEKSAMAARKREAERYKLGAGGRPIGADEERRMRLEELDLEEKEAKLQEERTATTQQRFNARMERMARTMKETFGGAGRLFTAGVDPHDEKALKDAQERIEEFNKASRPQQIAGAIEEYKRLFDVFGPGSKQVQEANRAFNETFGADTGRKVKAVSDEVVAGLKAPAQAAEELSASLGHMSETERQTLADLGRDLSRAAVQIENALGKIAAAAAKLGIGDLFRDLAGTFASTAQEITVLISAFEKVGNVLEAITIGYQKLNAAAQIWIAANITGNKEVEQDFSKRFEELERQKAQLEKRMAGGGGEMEAAEAVPEDKSKQQRKELQDYYNYLGQGGTPERWSVGEREVPKPKQAEEAASALDSVKDAAKAVSDAFWDLVGRIGGQPPPQEEHKPMQFGGHVPGSGSGDTVPAMLEPGEFVVRKDGGNIREALRFFGFGYQEGGYVGTVDEQQRREMLFQQMGKELTAQKFSDPEWLAAERQAQQTQAALGHLSYQHPHGGRCYQEGGEVGEQKLSPAVRGRIDQLIKEGRIGPAGETADEYQRRLLGLPEIRGALEYGASFDNRIAHGVIWDEGEEERGRGGRGRDGGRERTGDGGDGGGGGGGGRSAGADEAARMAAAQDLSDKFYSCCEKLGLSVWSKTKNIDAAKAAYSRCGSVYDDPGAKACAATTEGFQGFGAIQPSDVNIWAENLLRTMAVGGPVGYAAGGCVGCGGHQAGGPIFAAAASLPGGVPHKIKIGGSETQFFSPILEHDILAGENILRGANIFRPLAEGGLVGGFVSSARGFQHGGAVASSAPAGPSPAGFHQLDLRTDKGSFRAAVSQDVMEALSSSALGSKLTRVGEKPSWYS